jgi:hypothetical protein
MKLIFANDEERKSGWILSPKFLKEIQDATLHNEDCPSLEGIEMVLMTYENIPNNR